MASRRPQTARRGGYPGFQRLSGVLQQLESQAASPDQSVPGDLQTTLAEAIAGCRLWLRRRMQEAPRDRWRRLLLLVVCLPLAHAGSAPVTVTGRTMAGA